MYSSQEQTIWSQLDAQLKVKQQHRRNMLVKEITSIMYLMGQDMVLDSNNPTNSNLYKLLELRTQGCPEMYQWLADRNYMSHDIINELINSVSHSVLSQIISPIRGEFYAILADETRDISNKEQLVVLFLWVDDSFVPHQDFVGLFDLPQADASTILTALNDVLVRCNILPSMCRGPAYDGAASISGHLNGVAASFKRDNPAAVYVHCLNLCLQETGKKFKVMRDALDFVLEVAHIVKQSPKQSHKFQVLKHEMAPGNSNLRTLCPTRWTVRTGAVKSGLDNYALLSTLMTEINEESYSDEAGGILAALDKFSTFYGLHLVLMCFSPTEQLSRTLQTVNISLQDAQKAVALTRNLIQGKRSDHVFEEFYQNVLKHSQGLTDAPVLPR
ncbi:zinc finger MYM-type protein 1-like [Girardinichthys multiradiatus]|uniref:zinc finger MYM-type protein 1-like n=1 Tax=Girardinichthys multiradiatus TaxID=208333 RepID=UPI001FAD0405|nr:zinc finger MYM-type protein 1-like [Girardinichthys multiradiatus]